MKAIRTLSIAAVFVIVGVVSGQDAQKPRPKQQEKKPDAGRLFERLDKNNDGMLSKDELPEKAQQAFDRLDKNNDGKIDKEEFKVMAERLVAAKPGADAGPERVQMMLKRLDANNDGKISKQEAQGPLAENFDRLDRNQDGALDKEELGRAIERLQNLAKPDKPRKPPAGDKPKKPESDKPKTGTEPPAAPTITIDFDRLDKDVDGRLTREEFKSAPLSDKFDQIDANKDGKIDPRELEAFLKKR